MKHQRKKTEKNDYDYGDLKFRQKALFDSTFFAKGGLEFMTDFESIEKTRMGRGQW